MVKEIKMYEAADGSTHRNRADALKSDLVHMLRQSTALNEASASALTDQLFADAEYRSNFAATLQCIDDLSAPE